MKLEQQLLDRLTPADQAALIKAARLLAGAKAAWDQIDSGKQCELNAVHNEEGSLAYCLRFGIQAADDLVEWACSPASTELSEADQAARGAKIAEVFYLRKDAEHKDRFKTDIGTKTALGVYLVAKRIVEEGL